MAEIIAVILALFKEILQMNKSLATWRFIAILITFLLAIAVWRLPEILTAIQ